MVQCITGLVSGSGPQGLPCAAIYWPTEFCQLPNGSSASLNLFTQPLFYGGTQFASMHPRMQTCCSCDQDVQNIPAFVDHKCHKGETTGK